MEGLINNYITDIDCGDFHSLALDDEGRLYSWGGGGQSYNKGQCGHGNDHDVSEPKQVQFFDGVRVTQVCAGSFHTLAVTENGHAYAWGHGSYGECGYGEFLNANKPHQVKFESPDEPRTNTIISRATHAGMRCV